MTYKQQLDDQRWEEKKLKIKQRDKFKCKICNSTLNLEVHHLYYIPKLKAWEYDDDGLVTVCNLHHDIMTYELPKLSGIISFQILTKQFEL